MIHNSVRALLNQLLQPLLGDTGILRDIGKRRAREEVTSTPEMTYGVAAFSEPMGPASKGTLSCDLRVMIYARPSRPREFEKVTFATVRVTHRA